MDNLATRILRHASETPHKLALHTGNLSLSYAQLEEQAKKAAHVMARKGVSPGSLVGISLRGGQETIIAMLGVWLAGGTCNLIDFRLTSAVKRSLTQAHGHVLVLDDQTRPDDGYANLSLAEWSEELAMAPAAPVSPAAGSGPAYLAFTSGTTGVPASMELSHQAMLSRAASTKGTDIERVYERYLNVAALAIGGAHAWVLNTLMAGGTVYFLPIIFRPRDLTEALAKYRITGCCLVPTVLRDLLGHVRESGKTLAGPETRLRLVTHGATIQPTELESVLELLTPHVLQFYACLPVGPVTLLDLNENSTKIDTVGRPLKGLEVEIVDPDDMPLPPNTLGQIRIKSPGRATVLKGRGEVSGSDRSLGDWYYPGDLGLIDADGYLKLMGRSTEVIIRGGINIYPQEVEAAIADMPEVRQAAAVGYHDERAGEEIAVFAVVGPGVTAKDLQRRFKARLPADKCPKRIEIVAEIPLNASGKTDRRKLAQMLG